MKGAETKMLQLKNVVKTYKTGDAVQDALKGVSVSFRDNEFVSVLGQSGSGKTTMLNIIGGLDRYSQGDLIISGVSTKKYTDADWDSYRNHKIGFIFQSYNLIPHQSVLANVEMALTLSGVSKKERRERAEKVLDRVGLTEHIHKKPNQMSGGQMQRVAIARALINDPEILLADEPTGALDTGTSVQIMELLKEIASDRLVIMVTHNPELAEEYSTRIVKLSDGEIVSDTDPYDGDEEPERKTASKKVSMSFLTALSLSFNNLRTKKGRTILTAMAGSIGIIGIGLILAMSTGMNMYIESIQKDTMSSYPITIGSEALDTGALFTPPSPEEQQTEASETEKRTDGIYSSHRALETNKMINTVIKENDLAAFKKYIDDPDSEIRQYLGEKGVQYNYDVVFEVFTADADGKIISTDSKPQLEQSEDSGNFLSNLLSGGLFSGSGNETAGSFKQIPDGEGEGLVPDEVKNNYELLYGKWPEKNTDMVLVLGRDNSISLEEMFSLGLVSNEEYNAVAESINAGNETPPIKLSYSDVCGKEYYLLTKADRYRKQENGTFLYVEEIVSSDDIPDTAITLTISGVVQRKEGAEGASLSGPVSYTKALREHIISQSGSSQPVKAQMASPEVNVLNGMKFDIPSDEEKTQSTKEYLASLPQSEKAAVYKMISLFGMGEAFDGTGSDGQSSAVQGEAVSYVAPVSQKNGGLLEGITEFIGNIFTGAKNAVDNIKSAFAMLDAFNEFKEKYPDFDFNDVSGMMEDLQSGNIENILGEIDIEALIKDYLGGDLSGLAQGDKYFADQLDKWLEDSPDTQILLMVYDRYIAGSTYEKNLDAFGYIDLDKPSSISLYADNFEDKDELARCIKEYNDSVAEEQKIAYTDYAAMLTSSLTSIINGISYVLVAFVAISLFVSGIMIGIITHISVMERTKEIGILRALGASKKNISQVFNAETFIIGCFSGLLGVGISLLCLIPINLIIESKTGIENLDAQLPLSSCISLIIVSVVITLVGGLIPALKAAKKDPVVALRTE